MGGLARGFDEEIISEYIRSGRLCTLVKVPVDWNCNDEDLLKPQERIIPTNRSETANEALADSILTFLPSNITEPILKQAFCRDVESFSDVFEVDDLHHRPTGCPTIEDSHCATLYDSSSCNRGWRLNVDNGDQKRLKYFSSDWKFRNDADVVGVKRGCTFTGYTGDSFNGDNFVLTAGDTDRWVVFADSQDYRRFHESILSFTCFCRT